MNENIIEIKNLSKKYDEYAEFGLEDVNISLPQGSVMGFIGRNGAGKTTTIKLMLNQLNKDTGDIKVFGLDSVKDEIKIKDDIGVVFAENHFHENFTPEIIGRIMRNVYSKWDDKLYKKYLKEFDLIFDKKIKEQSHGMKMKTALAVALAHRPKLLILDEATSGLDPVARTELMDIFYDFTQNGENSIFFSTHITSDLDHIADYITLIDDGKIILTVTKEQLDENYGIAKCKKQDMAIIPDSIIVGARETDFSTEILVNNRAKAAGLNPNMVIDKILVEDLMTYTEGKSK